MAIEKTIINGEEHTIKWPGVCILDISYENNRGMVGTVLQGEMRDGMIIIANVDFGQAEILSFQRFIIGDARYDLNPSLSGGTLFFTGMLMGQTVFVRQVEEAQ